MKTYLKAILILLCLMHWGDSQANETGVIRALNDYLQGTQMGDPARIQNAFHPQAQLLLSHDKKPFWTVTASQYSSWFGRQTDKQRRGKILSLKIDGDIATARLKIAVSPPYQAFIDHVLLKRIAGIWQIVSKTATQQSTQYKDKKILFIASSASFHGDSDLPAGTSFSELVYAYDTFIKAGYEVDFMSTRGGPLSLSYINTSMPIHKHYLYDPEFMYAIGHSLTPEQVDASQYLAVHYVGGSNAMYEVAEHPQIQSIAMQVYEQNNGIISAVCHGTAGIVNLKLNSGEYLVANKRVSGYPESFERQDAAYFKEFPFLIGQQVKAHGGVFSHGERNTSFVEVDGRLITGQNYLSSVAVAQAMIAVLEKI
ncbi:nuclear transport factor 2 family protein [Pseudoalteromonas sp. OOF1S-7]|uniref:nuclear transport factor 2 family protein n=1 Tax=Pseudoalteromonas sp. OOF1S-7 TaxID=2917757 RepID=UPI001EF5CCF7|nr:nuclear transport factor 2 family protein [Pseudoalteromonas sp. OOF1S-7]MCG7535979.1 nuclear transport factor 2 family protein [Pseudoalteromonas sp. OOF1S-7]